MVKENVVKSPTHLVVRYSDNFAPKGEGTISVHGKILKEHGYVWLGKFGKPMGRERMTMFLKQIQEGKNSYIFLVRSGKRDQQIIVGRFADVRRTLQKDDLKKVPKYYCDKGKMIGVWFKIKQFWAVGIELLNSLIGTSSGIPVSHSLHCSLAGMFFVKTAKDFSLTKAGAKKMNF